MSIKVCVYRSGIGAPRIYNLRHRQEGVVLVFSLLLLLIMTLIGMTAMHTTALEERMAGNMRDRNVSIQAAEAALRDSESWIASLGNQPLAVTTWATCSTPPCVWQLNTLPDISSQSQSWWLNNAREYGVAGTKDIAEVNTDPRYVVEAVTTIVNPDNLDTGQGARTGTNLYRITAHGTGATDDAQAILQSTYAKRFN